MLSIKTFKRHVPIFLSCCLLAGAPLLLQGQHQLAKLKNYVAVSDSLHTCGSIDEDDLRAIRNEGINAIIGLSTESPSEITLHKQIAKSLGLTYDHIPVSWQNPSILSLERFFDSMDRNKNSKLLVHCRLNWRASAYVYLYRVIRLGTDETEARKQMRTVWNPAKDKTWSAFLTRAKDHFKIK